MNKIYVLTAQGGEYDDKWTSNIAAFTTPEAAFAECVRLTDVNARLLSVKKEIEAAGKAAADLVAASIPEPDMHYVAPPKGPIRPTPQELAQHEQLLIFWADDNQKRVEAWNERETKVNEAGERAARAKAVELGCTPEEIELLNFGRHGRVTAELDVDYDVNELELRS